MSETLKVFVGGLSQDTTKASLDAYFGQFGTADSFIMVDKMTGRSRGFGFLNFSDEGVVQQVLACAHEVDGTPVTCSAYSQGGGGRGPAGGGGGGAGGFGGGASTGQLKCFIGGLSQETTKASLDAYFGQFGFADTYVMVDKATGRSRGFGFVNFREENAMNVVLQMQHEVDGTSVNVSAYADKGGGRPGPGAPGISLAMGGKGGGKGGGGGTAAVAAAAVAQALQALGLGGGQNHAVQQMVQQAVQQAVGGQAPLGGGGGGARGGGGGSGGGPKHLKIFVGGLAQHTTKESMSAYFSQFGQADAFIMMDKSSGRSRGFGFVDFQDEQVVQVVLQSAHQIDGQMVNVSPYGGGAGGGGGAPPPQAAAPNLLGGAGGIAGILAGLQGGAKPGRFSPY